MDQEENLPVTQEVSNEPLQDTSAGPQYEASAFPVATEGPAVETDLSVSENLFDEDPFVVEADPDIFDMLSGKGEEVDTEVYKDQINTFIFDLETRKAVTRNDLRNVTRSYVEQFVSNELSKDIPDLDGMRELADLADDPNYGLYLEATRDSLADPDEKENNRDVVKAQMQKNIQAAGKYLDGARAIVSSQFAEKSAARLIGEGFESIVSLTGQQAVINAVSAVFPEVKAIGRLSSGSVMRYAAEQIKNANSEEVAANWTRSLIKQLKDRAGDLGENTFAFESALDTLDGFVRGDSGVGAEAFENLVGILELAGIGGTVKAIGKGAAKAAERVIDRIIPIEIPLMSPASIATTTKKGTEKIIKSIDNPEELGAMGIKVEEAVGSVVLPKVFDGVATVRALVDPNAVDLPGLEKRLFNSSSRTADIQITPGVDGFEATYFMGKTDGTLFKRKQDVQTFIKREFDNAEDVIPVEVAKNQWAAKVTAKGDYGFQDLAAYGDDVFESTKGLTGYIKKLTGKATQFSKDFVNGSTVATLQSAQIERQLLNILKPLDSLLGKSKSKVMNVIREGDVFYDPVEDKVGKWFTDAELLNRGFSSKEIDGYKAFRRASETTLAIKNKTVRDIAIAQGWKSLKLGDDAGQLMVRKSGGAENADKVYDTATKSFVKNSPEDRLKYDYYFARGEDIGSSPIRVPKGTALDDLPQSMIKKVDGYMPRFYKAPYIVQQLTEGGRFVAQATARSKQEADEIIEKLKEADPQGNYSARRPLENQGQPETFDDLEELLANGLLYINKRRKTPLKDIDGKNSALMSPERSIASLVNSAAMSGGIRRWTAVQKARWEKTFKGANGKPLKFNEFKAPIRTDLAGEEEYLAAKAMWDHINMVDGVHPAQIEGAINGLKNAIFDGIQSVVPTKVGKRVVADTLSGSVQKISSTSKTAAFLAYMGLNPIASGVMQMTMIPTYAGVAGGLKYVASANGFFRDMAILAADKVSKESVRDLATKLGMKEDEVLAITEGYKRSGLDNLVDNHIFTMGTLVDSSVAKTGMVSDIASRVVEKSKNIGFDLGTKTDKRAAYLFSLNRFKVQNGGRLPKTQDEWDKIGADAEALSLNQNRSDMLPTQNMPVISIFTQFMGHQFKMTGRLLGMEKNFTAAEKARMAVIGALSYGTSGYGMYYVTDRVLQELGFDLGEEDKKDLQNIVRDGFGGYAVDLMMDFGSDVDRATDLATGQKYGPANAGFFGITPDSLLKVFDGSLSTVEFQEKILGTLDAPALGLAKNVYEAAKFGAAVGGVSGFTDQEKGLAAGIKALKAFPIVNNAIKGWLGVQLGYKVDSKGNKVVEATLGEIMGQGVLGIPSASEVDFRTAQDRFYSGGMFGGGDPDQDAEAYGKAVAQDVILPLLNSFTTRERSREEVLDIILGYNAISELALDPVTLRIYRDTIRREVDKSGVTKSESFRDMLYEEMNKGSRIMNGNMYDTIRDLPYLNDQQRQQFLDKFNELRGYQQEKRTIE